MYDGIGKDPNKEQMLAFLDEEYEGLIAILNTNSNEAKTPADQISPDNNSRTS